MRIKVVELRNNRGDVRWEVREYSQYGDDEFGLPLKRYRSRKRAERRAESRRALLRWYEDKAFRPIVGEEQK